MTALNPNNTARYKQAYTFAGIEHQFQVRANGIFSPSAMGTFVDALFDALDPNLFPITIGVCQFAAAGSNIYNIVTTGAEGHTYGHSTPSDLLKPQFCAFQGRTTGGHKVRLSIFGINNEPTDYRFNPGELATIDAAVVVLQATANGALGIDGLKPRWYDYANFGFNAYWQRKARG